MKMTRRWGLAAALVLFLIGLSVWRLTATGEGPAGEPPLVTAEVSRVAPRAAPARAVDGAGEAVTASASPSNEPVRFGWGSGPNDLGRDRPKEGNPEAPMSLAIDSKGTRWVLDQVNKRLVRVDANGKHLPPLELLLQAAQDLAIAKDGTAAVMDRLVDKSVALISPEGKPMGELPLIGKGLTEGGAVTGVFIDGLNIVAERAHGDSVRLGSITGKRDEARTEVPGRPTRDARAYLTASIVSAAEGTVMLTVIDAATRAHRFTRQYTMPAAASSIVLLDGDVHGTVYLGAMLGTQPLSTAVLCVDALDGHPLGLAKLPVNSSADETFREVAISDDGDIVMLVRAENGAGLLRASCSAM